MALPRTAAKRRARKLRISKNAKARYRAAQNDPSQVTRPLTPKTLRKEEAAAERLRYQPQRNQLDSERRISEEAERRTGSYYDRYLADLKGLSDQVQASYAKAQQDAAARVDPGSGVHSPEEAQARAARQATQGGFQTLLGTLGANQNASFAGRQQVGGLRKIEALTDEQKRRRQIEQSGRDLAKEAGDFRVDYRVKRRNEERQYGLERAAFGLKEQDAASDAAAQRSQARARKSDDRAARAKERRRQMEADRRYQLDREKFGHQVAKDNYNRRNKGKGGSGGGSGGSSFTGTQRRNGKKTFREALGKARVYANAGGNPSQVATFLREKKGVKDPLVARAAVQTALYGGVDAKTRKQYHDAYGVWLRLRPKRSNKAPSTTDATGGYGD